MIDIDKLTFWYFPNVHGKKYWLFSVGIKTNVQDNNFNFIDNIKQTVNVISTAWQTEQSF